MKKSEFLYKNQIKRSQKVEEWRKLKSKPIQRISKSSFQFYRLEYNFCPSNTASQERVTVTARWYCIEICLSKTECVSCNKKSINVKLRTVQNVYMIITMNKNYHKFTVCWNFLLIFIFYASFEEVECKLTNKNGLYRLVFVLSRYRRGEFLC